MIYNFMRIVTLVFSRFQEPYLIYRATMRFLNTLSLVLVFFAGAAVAVAGEPVVEGVKSNTADKPNVVIVITDDQGYGDLSCHGNPILKTPNIDSLYAESIRLKDYHVAPTCSPTRAALQSGHWTNRTGVWHTICLLYTSPSPRDATLSRMPSSA